MTSHPPKTHAPSIQKAIQIKAKAPTTRRKANIMLGISKRFTALPHCVLPEQHFPAIPSTHGALQPRLDLSNIRLPQSIRFCRMVAVSRSHGTLPEYRRGTGRSGEIRGSIPWKRVTASWSISMTARTRALRARGRSKFALSPNRTPHCSGGAGVLAPKATCRKLRVQG